MVDFDQVSPYANVVPLCTLTETMNASITFATTMARVARQVLR
jgi:hypothetical protein